METKQQREVKIAGWHLGWHLLGASGLSGPLGPMGPISGSHKGLTTPKDEEEEEEETRKKN